MAMRKTKPLKKLGLVAKRKPAAKRVLAEIHALSKKLNLELVCENLTATWAGLKGVESMPRDDMAKAVDAIVVLGGDGTLLSVARTAAPYKTPILGVNLGTLGFLTEVPRKQFAEAIEHVASGRYRIVERMMLRCRLLRNKKEIDVRDVLNDVVINKSAIARILDLGLYVQNQLVQLYQSDGLIVSTPTGSTAYSLAAGGPIVSPAVDAMVVTPICPHSLINRPLVVSSRMALTVELKTKAQSVFLTLDGQEGYSLEYGDRVEIKKSRHKTRLIRAFGRNHYDVLRDKLNWGPR